MRSDRREAGPPRARRSRGTGRSWRLVRPPEPGRAAHAAGIAMARRYQPRRNAVGKHIIAPEPGDTIVEPRDLADPAADDDDVRIEQVHDGGEGTGEPVLVADEAGLGARIARRGALGDARRIGCLASCLTMVEGQPGAGKEALDAASLAAVARRSRALGIARPGQRRVGPVAGDRAPGMPTPTVPCRPVATSMHVTSSRTAARVAS